MISSLGISGVEWQSVDVEITLFELDDTTVAVASLEAFTDSVEWVLGWVGALVNAKGIATSSAYGLSLEEVVVLVGQLQLLLFVLLILGHKLTKYFLSINCKFIIDKIISKDREFNALGSFNASALSEALYEFLATQIIVAFGVGAVVIAEGLVFLNRGDQVVFIGFNNWLHLVDPLKSELGLSLNEFVLDELFHLKSFLLSECFVLGLELLEVSQEVVQGGLVESHFHVKGLQEVVKVESSMVSNWWRVSVLIWCLSWWSKAD